MSEVFWDCPTCGWHNPEQAAEAEPMFDVMSRCKNEECKQGVVIHIYRHNVNVAATIPKSPQ